MARTTPARRREPQAPDPIARLRAYITALEAVSARVLAKPSREAVHDLRTGSRRIEAQLDLLALAGHAETLDTKATRKVRKLLAGLRREAGKVRDLDVQRDLLKEAANDQADDDAKSLSREARKMRAHLKLAREREAETLVAAVRRHALRLGPQLESIVNSLEDQPVPSPTKLPAAMRASYGDRLAAANAVADPTERLHSIRKSAKLARYMAEGSGEPHLAAHFESIQESGGVWHDNLTLLQVATEILGKKSELARVFAARESDTRTAFERKVSVHPL